MTKHQRRWLMEAAQLKPTQFLRVGARSRGGGSIRRMFERLRGDGLLKGPPWKITAAGRKALAD